MSHLAGALLSLLHSNPQPERRARRQEERMRVFSPLRAKNRNLLSVSEGRETCLLLLVKKVLELRIQFQWIAFWS